MINMISRPMPVTNKAQNTNARMTTRAKPIGRPSRKPTTCSFIARKPGLAARIASK
jgi:hypothetical protein